MRVRGRGRDSDVIDVRGGGGGGLQVGRAGGGVGVVGIVIFLAIQLLGGGSGATFDVPAGLGGGTSAAQGQPIPASMDPDRDLRDFSSYVFTDVQDAWTKMFTAEQRPYRRAKLVLYRGSTGTGCGTGTAAQGPFYCPADERVYLDLSFYREMQSQLKAGGDFAWAYVIGHELGHHIQKLLGQSDKVAELTRAHPDDANALSVRLELQADCYAGVWARTAFDDLEPGDLQEAFTASQAVGDDRLQKQAGRRVDTDSFTHGSSAQRLKWFKRGEANGEPADCDTFSGDV